MTFRSKALLWCALALPQASMALEWGALQFFAAADKPAYVQVRLQHAGPIDPTQLRIAIATSQAYAAAGLKYHPALANMPIQIVAYRGSPDKVDIRLSGLPADATQLDFLLTASDRVSLALAQYQVTTQGGNAQFAPSIPGAVGASHATADSAPAQAAVLQWAQAWSQRDVDAYMASYVPHYAGTPARASRKAWVDERRSRILGRQRIAVTISDWQLQPDAGKWVASFKQVYVADGRSETSRKRMVLVAVNGKWLIESEVETGRR
jgi:hypothetical protein